MNRSSLRLLSGNILVFSLTDMLGNFVRSAVFPYASLYILALGGDPAEIGFVNTLGLLAGVIMLPIAGALTGQVNRVRLLAVSSFLSSLFLALIMTAPNWQVVAAAFLLFGTVVFQFPAYASLVADSLAPGDRGKGLGLMNAISASLAIFAPFFAGLVIERFSANLGMRLLYGLMMAVYLLVAVLQLRHLKEPNPEGRVGFSWRAVLAALQQAYSGIPALLRGLPVPARALAGVVLLSFLSNGVSTAFWVVYATEEIGLSPAAWGTILLIEGVVRMASFLPAGWIADRLGRTQALVAALAITLVAAPLFLLVRSFAAALLIRAVIAAAFGLALPASMALMADLTPRRQRGEIMAAIGQGGIMLHPAGGGVGGPALGYLFILPAMAATLAGGLLYKLHPAYPFVFAAVATLVSIVIAVAYIRDPHTAEV
jgi:MFS transporter, DHA1 family, multidrug resistance protein